MMGHTPEPWTWVESSQRGTDSCGILRGMFGDKPAIYPIFNTPGVIDGPTLEVQKDDISRVVAAVNACAGIPTEALEADVVRRMREMLREFVRIADGETLQWAKDLSISEVNVYSEARALLRSIDEGRQ